MIALIDMDGTLIDIDDNPRPGVAELIRGLHDAGFTIIIWSGGGGDEYAGRKFNAICQRIGVDLRPMIHSYVFKGDSKKLVFGRPQFYIDDVEEVIEAGKARRKESSGYKVPFYAASLGEDTHLTQALKSALEWKQKLEVA